MAPTLDQVLNFFRNHDLPTETDSTFNSVTVGGLPVCNVDDAGLPGARPNELQRYRVLGYTDNPNNVLFLPSNQVTPTASFAAPTDAFLRRILSATGGLAYEERGNNGATNPAVLALCRDASPLSGTGADARYAVYVSRNAILNHRNPGVPGLMPIDIPLLPSEIVAIVSGLRGPDGNTFRIPDEHYGVNGSDRNQLSLFPEDVELRRIITGITAPNSPIAASRRQPIVDAINRILNSDARRMARDQSTAQREGLDLQRGMRNEMRWQMIGMGALTVYTTLLALGKAGPLNYALSFPFRALFTPLIEGAINVFNRAMGREVNWRWTDQFFGDAASRIRYRSIPTLNQIGTNLSELARRGEVRPVADSSTPDVAKRIENVLNSQHNTMSVLVEGPPGWGKEVLMRELARRNPGTIYIQVTPNSMMGGTMYRGQLEQRITDITNELAAARKNGQPVVLCIDEFHEALSAGKSMENAVSLLEHFKGPLARGEIRIAGFSTPREMLKARYIAGYYNDAASVARLSPEFRAEIAQFQRDGVKQNIELRALLNRFQAVPLTPRSNADIQAIIRDTIAQRAETGLRINMDDAAIERIAELSHSAMASEGFIPRTALAIFNGVVDEQLNSGASSVNVDAATVDNFTHTAFPEIAQRFNITGSTPPPPSGGNGGNPPPVDPNRDSTPPPSGNGAVADSSVIHGADAQPTGNISRDVVRAQVLQRFPRFLSQAARDAMTDGRALPTGPDLINSAYSREVEALTNRVIAQYHTRAEANRAGVDRLWETDRSGAGIVRDGVPDSLLREVANDYIAQEAARDGSPFGGGAADGFRADADRTLEAAEFERRMDMLRHIGR